MNFPEKEVSFESTWDAGRKVHTWAYLTTEEIKCRSRVSATRILEKYKSKEQEKTRNRT